MQDWKEYINKVNCMDCMDLLKIIPDKSIDLVLTDQPYGMNLDTDFSGMVSDLTGGGKYKGKLCGNKYSKVIGDDNFDFIPFWEIVKNKSNKHIYFGIDYYMPLEISKLGSISIWDKRLTDSADKMFGSCYEMLWFYPKKKKDIIRYKWAGIFGMENEKINKRLHPTQKPENLIKKLIMENSKEGDLILDPFMGSWTTARACKDLNRNFIGCELDESYCKIGEDRLRQEILL